MIKLAYCDVSNLNLDVAYNLVSDSRKNKIDVYRFDKDKKLSSGVYILLKYLLDLENIENPTFMTSEYGKGYISNYDDIYFNLSHSDKMVACGISDCEIGVDVEFNDSEIDLDIAKNYFFNEEYYSIINANKPSDEFFSYWVLKESYMKYTGLGMNLKLDSFCILKNNEIKLKDDKEKLKFSLFDIDGYKLASCGKYKVKNPIEIDINDII